MRQVRQQRINDERVGLTRSKVVQILRMINARGYEACGQE